MRLSDLVFLLRLSVATSNISYYYLKYDPYFELGGASGEIHIKRRLKNDHKYVLYILARDNGIPKEEISKYATKSLLKVFMPGGRKNFNRAAGLSETKQHWWALDGAGWH